MEIWLISLLQDIKDFAFHNKFLLFLPPQNNNTGCAMVHIHVLFALLISI